MSMKKFQDKKSRPRRCRHRHQIKHKISGVEIFIYNKLKEKLNWTLRDETSLGDKKYYSENNLLKAFYAI